MLYPRPHLAHFRPQLRGCVVTESPLNTLPQSNLQLKTRVTRPAREREKSSLSPLWFAAVLTILVLLLLLNEQGEAKRLLLCVGYVHRVSRGVPKVGLLRPADARRGKKPELGSAVCCWKKWLAVGRSGMSSRSSLANMYRVRAIFCLSLSSLGLG